jgi:sporulation protein YqfC
MFRIIVENKNSILLEGVNDIKSFAPDYILINMKDTFLELSGKDFYINKLGEGYMQIIGELSEIKYTPQ